MRIAPALIAVLFASTLSGCAVVSVVGTAASVAGTAVSTAASVAGTVVSTTADVVGTGVRKVVGSGEKKD